MKRLLFILPVIFLIGCTLTPKKNVQSMAIKKMASLSGVTKAGALLLYAEDYRSQTNADFSKADLRVVLLMIQNTSTDGSYQLNSHDIEGIGDFKTVKQRDYDEAMYLMESSDQFIKSAKKGKVAITLKNVTIGALVGGITVGGYIGYDLISFTVAAAAGAVIGGSYGFIEGVKGHEIYTETNAMGIIAGEIITEKLPALIMVPPGSKIIGILIFHKDVRALAVNLKGTIYHIDIH